jgi:hypothetical protein
MPFPDPVRLAVQVEESACGRERGAPASADRVAAEGARSRPAHEQRPVVLGPPVPMVSSGPQGHHDHPARDPILDAFCNEPQMLTMFIVLNAPPVETRQTIKSRPMLARIRMHQLCAYGASADGS